MTFTVNIRQTVPLVTQQDIRRKFMYRYFASRGNQIDTTIYEISRRDYDTYVDNRFIILGHLKWVIVGKLEDTTMDLYTGNPTHEAGLEPIFFPGVLTQNQASVRFLSRKIPAATSYLRKYDQFYVGE